MPNAFITILKTLATYGSTTPTELKLLSCVEDGFYPCLRQMEDMNLAYSNIESHYESITPAGYKWLECLRARGGDDAMFDVDGLADIHREIQSKYKAGEEFTSNQITASIRGNIETCLQTLVALKYLVERHKDDWENGRTYISYIVKQQQTS